MQYFIIVLLFIINLNAEPNSVDKLFGFLRIDKIAQDVVIKQQDSEVQLTYTQELYNLLNR